MNAVMNTVMNAVIPRIRETVLALLCVFISPILLLMMLLQALFGDMRRARNMAVCIDSCANSLFGGLPNDTISARAGRAYLENRSWARIIAPIIDALFGKNHCIDAALANPLGFPPHQSGEGNHG